MVTAPFAKHAFPASSQVAVVAAGAVVPVEVEAAVEVEGVVTQTPKMVSLIKWICKIQGTHLPEEHSKPEAESQAPAQF